MKDKDIIKALGECTKHTECEACHFRDECYDLGVLHKNTLALITRQQAEIENLKVENQSLRGAANSLKMHLEEAQAEIERLQKIEIETDDFCRRLCRMRMLNGRAIASYEDLQNYIQYEKSESVKEFAERLKEQYAVYNGMEYVKVDLKTLLNTIDYLVKETAGD